MSTWTPEYSRPTEAENALSRYAPKDIANSRDFARELQSIDGNPTLTMMDKQRYKKQLMRAVFMAKQQEINHHLDSFENYLLARKDVEARSITLEAQKAIMLLEQEQLEMMKQIGLAHADEVDNTLIKAGTMLTAKIHEIEQSTMLPDIKKQTLIHVRRVWERTNARIMESVETYMDELYRKERERVR